MPRPRLDPDDDTVVISVRVPKTIRDIATRRANANGTTLSAKLRAAVEGYAAGANPQ